MCLVFVYARIDKIFLKVFASVISFVFNLHVRMSKLNTTVIALKNKAFKLVRFNFQLH